MPQITHPTTRRAPRWALLGLVLALAAVLVACDVPVKPAGKLFDAWKAGDSGAAAPYATVAARTQMFSDAYAASAGWTFITCDGAAGSTYCTWVNKAEGRLQMRVDNASQKVTEVTRISLGNTPAGRTFHAWRVGQPDLATSYSTSSARSALFAKAYHAADHWLPQGCEGAAGSTYCTWTNDAAKTIVLRVDNTSSPQRVVAVTGTYA